MKKVCLTVAGLVFAAASAGCNATTRAASQADLQGWMSHMETRISTVEERQHALEGRVQEDAARRTAAVKTPRSPAAGTQVSSAPPKPTHRNIQKALKNAGFYDGPVDGKVGPKTRDAIRRFQQVNKLNEDGVVGKKTWDQLAAHH